MPLEIANSPTRWISSLSLNLLVGGSTRSYFLLFLLPSVAALANQSEPVLRVTGETVNFEIEIASSLKVFAYSWEIITSRSKLTASIFHEDHTVTARSNSFPAVACLPCVPIPKDSWQVNLLCCRLSRDYLVLQWWQMKLLQVLEPWSLETISRWQLLLFGL